VRGYFAIYIQGRLHHKVDTYNHSSQSKTQIMDSVELT
jgi:hypothetical protein